MGDYIPKAAEQLHRHYDTLITGDLHPSDHPVSKGNAREHGWRKMFRRFLPDRFGVKSGFIIDSKGKISDQIDCIIYRKDIGIELYSVGQETVIPVEAVFATFEVKPTINSKTIKYAQEKANSVSQLIVSNYLLWNKDGVLESYLEPVSAGRAIVFGLLADSVSWKNGWKVKSFKNILQNSETEIALFMTVNDGCVNTLETGYPTDTYSFFDGPHALLNQLIKLVEILTALESRRCMSSSCLDKYAHHLDKPKSIRI